MFYGSYSSNLIAIRFTEFILMIVTSINNLHDLSQFELENLNTLITNLSNTLLIPYIHIAEREKEIWDKGNNEQLTFYNPAKHLINDRLREISKGNYAENYNGLFQLLNDVKVAQWPYERDN